MDNRFFRLSGKVIAFDALPVFPLTELDHTPAAADWEKLPCITSFRARQTDDLAPAGEFSARFALASGMLQLHVECRTFSRAVLPMRKSYVSWCFDNSAEFFIADPHSNHQFLLNAEGASVHYLNRVRTGPVKEGSVSGSRKPGFWTVDFSFPADQLLGNGEAAFKLVLTDISSILGAQYYDSLNNDCEGYGLLKLGAAAADPVFSGAGANPPDWELLRNMARSACRRSGFPQPDLSSPELIRGVLHDVMPALLPQRQAVPRIDFSRETERIRPLYGVNFGPKITNQANHDMNAAYRKLGASSMRTHDVPLSEPGSRLVDTIFVFPLEHADPSDPANYFFDQTDYYFSNTMEQGPEVYYRLGVSIDHAKRKFTAHMPKDFHHFAEVCAGIVRHYNHGWADGHHWNIRYWEIWNEPEMSSMWDGTFEDYMEMFIIVCKRLKEEFPEIKVGGFGAVGLTIPKFRQLAKKCREHGVKPDFVSWHHYSSNLEAMCFQPYAARFMADAVGLEQAELHLTEWHYVNISGGAAGYKDMGGVDSAAFTASTIAAWQDSPMDLSHYYTAGFGSWGIFDYYCEPKKVYYALCSCGLFQTRYRQRVHTVQGPEGTRLLAAKDAEGNKLILYSCFKLETGKVRLDIAGIPDAAPVRVSVLDERHSMEPVEFTRAGSVIEIAKAPGSAVFQIEIPKSEIP